MPGDAKFVIDQWGQLLAQRIQHEFEWQELADIALPGKNDIITRILPGNLRTHEIFDTTLMMANDFLASQLNAAVTNFGTRWFDLQMMALPRNREANRWFDEVGRLMLEAMTADTSPLATALHEMYLQYSLFGTGALFVDEKSFNINNPTTNFRGIHAASIPIGTYVIADGGHGTVDTLHRMIELTPRQAEQIFGFEALAPQMREVLRDSTKAVAQHEYHNFIHACYPRTDFRDSDRFPREFNWVSQYVDESNAHMVSEGGFRQFPYMVPRWQRFNAGSAWGYGRGHLALPEARTLNLIDQDVLSMLQLYTFPPVWLIGAQDETVGRVSLLPGALNPIASGGAVQWQAPGGNFDVTRLSTEERRQRIERIFYQDILQPLPNPADPGSMTATEVLQRIRLMSSVMGAAFQRLLSELLNPLIDQVFSLMLNAGEFPPIPDVILAAAAEQGGQINVEYLGPLARAQRIDEVEAIDELIGVVTTVSANTNDPLYLENIDIDGAIRRRAEIMGFPRHLIRDDREMQAIRQQALAQQQAQLEAQQIAQGAQALGNAAPGIRELRGIASEPGGSNIIRELATVAGA